MVMLLKLSEQGRGSGFKTRTCGSAGQAAEEGIVFFSLDDALEMKRGFAQVIIAPQTRFAARDLAAVWNVVPATRAVIDRVQQQTLMPHAKSDSHLL